MGQLQKIAVNITGFIFLDSTETIEDLQERFEHNLVSLDFDDGRESMEIEYATINEQE